jgi:hypothetical protein
MRCRCPGPVPVVPARLGMLGAAVTGWLLLLNGVRCAQVVTGSNNMMMVMAGFMLASIAPPTNNVNMAGPTRNYSPDRVVDSACPAIPHPPKPPVLGRTLTERSLTAALFF